MAKNASNVDVVPDLSDSRESGGGAPAQRPSVTSRNWRGPRTLNVSRDHQGGYGFTLRYFVVYPPPCVYKEESDDQDSYWSDFELNDDEICEKRPEPLDTFFVKNVVPGGPADSAGLNEGDRIVSINGNLIGGKSYKEVVELIQSCTGDLKIGVVPKDEDILQLAYQEYVYDGASLGYTQGLERLAQDFDMHQPSANKWSTPVVGTSRKSSDDTGAENVTSKVKKYDPCVSFAAGTPVLKPDVKFSLTVKPGHSNSNSSSGNSTPGIRTAVASSPPVKIKKVVDPCVTFVAGKPILTPPDENTAEENFLNKDAVNPVTLNNALNKTLFSQENFENSPIKKGRIIVKQHFDRDAIQVATPGMVNRVRSNYNTNTNNKKSAISVLREDFREPATIESAENGDISPVSPDPTFQLSVAVAEPETSQSKATTTFSRDLITRGQRARAGGHLTSLTSQATLVESKTASYAPFDRNQTARRGIRSHPNSAVHESGNRRGHQGNKIGFVVAARDHHVSHKISSSSDISDDDSAVEYGKDVDGTSADESDPFSKKGSRRVSYLMATATSPTVKMPHKFSDVSNPEADDEDSDALNNSQHLQRQYSQESVETEADDMKGLPAVQEGWLNKKLVHSSDGRKRASSRTWKSLYAVLRGHFLYCYKDKIDHDSSWFDEDQVQIINLKGSVVNIAHDYAKRKHVFRLTTHTGSEFLFQAADTQSLMAWVNSLRESNPEKDANGNAYENVIVKRMKSYEGDASTNNSGTSPPGTTKPNTGKRGLSLKKTHFTLGYKNAKKRGFVNIHISHAKDKEVQATGYTFGIPLDQCPPGKDNKFVPILIEHCCQVVEKKGMDYLGIYRVPGNAAAVQLLQEELDTKDPDSISFEEEKWHDLNNIGSLLKSFLRKLPEPLIPKDIYTKVIQANREEDSNERLRNLRMLVRNLPDYHNQTLRYLVLHLRKIADHSDINKMEPKNLAIVFGPTVVRTSDENMVSMVKDMSDQCRIIETLIHQADWIYSDDETTDLVNEEPVKQENDGRCYVASRGLLESLGQMAENYDGGDQPAKTKDKQSVASAIMSLTNFTSGISLKLRNKAMSPVFSKKYTKGDPNSSPEADSLSPTNTDETSNMSQLRRLGSDPQILSHDCDNQSKPTYKSEGENDEDFTRVKSKIKSKYSRAVPLSSPSDKRPLKPCASEPCRPTNRGANITFQIPVRTEVTVRDEPKKDSVLDAYKAAMLSEKTKLRLQKVSVEHQAAVDKRQVDKERIQREHEKTLQDLREEDDSLGDDTLSPRILRDSDDTVSSTSGSNASSRKESLDSLPSPSITRKYQMQQQIFSNGSTINSENKPVPYVLTPEEIEQREREKKQLDLFLGQFEISDEEHKKSPSNEKLSPSIDSPISAVTPVENLGAKSLDEKLRILLDPTFQEKDGKLVKKNSSTSSSNTSPVDTKDTGRTYDFLGYKSPNLNKKANFAASIRGLDKPLKTKVIGLSASKLNASMYNADMAARIDTFKQKKQELEKKVSSILQDSSKTKDVVYENDCNKTDEQKVASLRQKNQPFRLLNPTQRVIVSASDISSNRVAPIAFENPARANIESSLQRLDRNVQQVVELLQDSHMDELSGEHSELAALLNNLQRQAITEPDNSSSLWSKRQASKNLGNEDNGSVSVTRNKRNELPPGSESRLENTKPDLVRVQEWRTGPQLAGKPNLKYNKLYPR